MRCKFKTTALLELYVLSVVLFDFRWGNIGCERKQKTFAVSTSARIWKHNLIETCWPWSYGGLFWNNVMVFAWWNWTKQGIVKMHPWKMIEIRICPLHNENSTAIPLHLWWIIFNHYTHVHCATAKYFCQVIYECLKPLTKLCFLIHFEWRRMGIFITPIIEILVVNPPVWGFRCGLPLCC